MNNDEVVVTGFVAGYRTLADGTLRVTVDLDELQTAKFHEGFAHKALVAVARMADPEKSQS